MYIGFFLDVITACLLILINLLKMNRIFKSFRNPCLLNSLKLKSATHQTSVSLNFQRHFTASQYLSRQRHGEFEKNGPFNSDFEPRYLSEEPENDFELDQQEHSENAESESDFMDDIMFDDYVFPNDKSGRKISENPRIKLTGNSRNRKKNMSKGFYETDNNLIYVEGSESGEIHQGINKRDLEYIGPHGGLNLERLTESGMPNEPIVPFSYIEYEIPYSVEGYKNRQRVFEGYDADSSSTSQFTDLKVVHLESGKGGDGKVSFFRDAGHVKGPPDGGDGGDGGSVYVQAVEGETSLHKIRFHYKAEDGKSGAMSQLNGKTGKDLLIQVPVGTVVKWIPDPKLTNDENEELERRGNNLYMQVPAIQDKYEPEPLGLKLSREIYRDGEGWLFKDKSEEYHFEREYFLKLRERVSRYDHSVRRQEEYDDYFPIEGLDLDQPGPPVLMLRGGKGGLGNMHFLTQNIRNPRFAKKGRGKIGGFFLLELKLLADLGLVGLPNAGKSTLLRSISKARPRVGHWEFTTLKPTIGTISMGISVPSFTVADIPGIVKGARRENKGMGLDFLRHVERSGGLVFVVSLEEKSQDSVEDLKLLVDEVGPVRMKDKKVLVVATKADSEGSQERYLSLMKYCQSQGWMSIPCCAKRKENVEQVIKAMAHVSGKYA